MTTIFLQKVKCIKCWIWWREKNIKGKIKEKRKNGRKRYYSVEKIIENN